MPSISVTSTSSQSSCGAYRSQLVHRISLELAEEPGLWIPPGPSSELIAANGYHLVRWGARATVERIRLGDVEVALAETRHYAREHSLSSVTWWVGERSTPVGLEDKLLSAGLVPDDETPVLTSLTITSRPGGDSAVEVRRVRSYEDYIQAMELEWAVWNVPDSVRAERRSEARASWDLLVTGGRVGHYLALLEGLPVGFGRAVFTPHAAILMGGVTLPSARGHGVYTALVHARWAEAVERGTARLVVSAGAMSAPILLKLGFTQIGHVHLLCERL